MQTVEKNQKKDVFEKTLLNVYGEGSVNIWFCFNLIFLFSVTDVCY